MDLIADIGATTTRCGLLDDRGRLTAPEEFRNADFTGVPGVLKIYLGHRRASDQPRRAALAIAAPVHGDRIEMVNIDWAFSQNDLKAELNLSRLIVINDFAALAWALPELSAADVVQVGGGQAVPQQTMAVLGPGSGLGVATYVSAAEGGVIVAGEGGHITMPAANDIQADVIALLRQRLGRCSAERVLSGPGLMNLYWAVTQLEAQPRTAKSPAEITAAARRGEPLAMKTVEMFSAMLGTVAGDLALTVGARGGIYIGGGIVPRLLPAFAHSGFRGSFESKGRYDRYMAAIPTYVITAALPAFRGLRRLLGYR